MARRHSKTLSFKNWLKPTQFVAERGYDVQFGARPLKRAIQNYVEDGIAELIVNENIPLGSTISIKKIEGKDELSYTIV